MYIFDLFGCIYTTIGDACLCLQNWTNFCPYALISTPNVPYIFFTYNFPIPYLWTAFCVPLSFVFYEK